MKNISFESQITLKKTLSKTESEHSTSSYSINSDLLNNHYDNKSTALTYEILMNHFLKNKITKNEKFSYQLEQENIYKIFQEIIKNIIKYNNSERQDFIIKELLNYDKTQKQFNINSSSYLMSKIAYLMCLTFMKFINDKKKRNFFDFLYFFNFISEENYKKIQMKIYENNSENQLKIPKSLKILEMIQNTFSFIQKIKISLPFNSITNIDFNNYLFFLFNYNWIFCDIKEIEIDLTCLFIFFDNGKNYVREDEFYKLILAIFYLLIKIHDYEINSLKIIIPFTFSKELSHFLSKNLKEIKNNLIKDKNILNTEKLTLLNERSKNKIQIIEIIEHNFKHLINFSIEFNSIDYQSFMHINNFILKNPQIQYLTIIFFPITTENNSSLYLNHIQLKKICEIIDKNFKIINAESEYLNNNTIYYLDLLNSYFDENLKFLTEIFQNTLNDLSYLILDFSFPEIILNRENYCLNIITFIMNILYLINSNLIKVNNFEINYGNLIFDPIKYLYINEKLVTFEFGKNKILKSLNLNMKIINFENLFYLIPQNIVSLTLGKLCYKTTKSFIHDIKFLNKLNYLSFSIKSIIESQENNYQLLKEFINNNDLPTSLTEINVNCNMNIEYEQLKNLINENFMKNNFVQYWIFTFEFNNMKFITKNRYQKDLNTLIKNNENLLNYISTIKYNLKLSIIRIFYKKTNLFKNNKNNNSIDNPLSYKINSIEFAKIFKLIYMFLGKTKSKLVKIKLN